MLWLLLTELRLGFLTKVDRSVLKEPETTCDEQFQRKGPNSSAPMILKGMPVGSIIGIFFVYGPFSGVQVDVFPDAVHCFFRPDHVFVEPPLPLEPGESVLSEVLCDRSLV